MLVTFWTNVTDVESEKNRGLFLHMYENAEDLMYVCMICWKTNNFGNIFFQNYLLCALQEADVHIAKGSWWYSLRERACNCGCLRASAYCKLAPGKGTLFGGLIPNLPQLLKTLLLVQRDSWTWFEWSLPLTYWADPKVATASPLSQLNFISC